MKFEEAFPGIDWCTYDPHMKEGALSFKIQEAEIDSPDVVCTWEYELDKANTEKLRQLLAPGGSDEDLFKAIQQLIWEFEVLRFPLEFGSFCDENHIECDFSYHTSHSED